MKASPHEIHDRIAQLLQHLKKHTIDLYVVSSMDEHLNEYLPMYRQRLEAITGFSGSAGTALLCCEGKHQLFVDSRYHLQAEQEISLELFELQKLGLNQVPTVEKWFSQEEKKRGSLKIGFDPFTTSPKTYRFYQKNLHASNSQLIPIMPNLVDQVWKECPNAPCQPIYLLDPSWTGETVESKLGRIREKMAEQGVQVLILSKLDEVAWLTNLRGNDIENNPVFEAYCVVGLDNAICFSRMTPGEEVRHHLGSWIQFESYDHYRKCLQSLAKQDDLKIWLDPATTTMGTYLSLQKQKKNGQLEKSHLTRFHEQENPIVLFKALKNSTEIQQIRKAHHHAACGKIRSFVRLDDMLEQNQVVSEKDYADLLNEEYAREEGFADLSFTTIVGFAENGAIVHYTTPSPEKKIEPGHLLLIDSGIQIAGGTTDDTRTLSIGQPSQKQKKIYTRVLQAHIHLATQKFPEGTKGDALDGITRSSLWNAGLDYGHGTGHGVGAFLNVHEGPHSISPLSHTVSLQPGMVVSNEPGYYETNWGGVRLENLYVVTPAEGMPRHPGGKSWLQFDALTLIPFDHKLVDFSLLRKEEKQWLKKYHQQIWSNISGYLEGNDLEWLRATCQAFEK
ncbi:MAG: aminopeptidase P family protein [SAR324 cluster bacterium]|nr:aminopeptidase P family protein [SAR324 cluster bacterium]